jgi:hypothetical protein
MQLVFIKPCAGNAEKRHTSPIKSFTVTDSCEVVHQSNKIVQRDIKSVYDLEALLKRVLGIEYRISFIQLSTPVRAADEVLYFARYQMCRTCQWYYFI